MRRGSTSGPSSGRRSRSSPLGSSCGGRPRRRPATSCGPRIPAGSPSCSVVSSDRSARSAALRWQRLLARSRAVRYPPMLGYLLVGYLANNILPARLGELVRSHYLGDREGISRASALGTVVVERVVDLVAVVAIASVALLVLSVRGVVANAVLVGAAVDRPVRHRPRHRDRRPSPAGRRPGRRLRRALAEGRASWRRRLQEGLAVAAPAADGGRGGRPQRRWPGRCDPAAVAAAGQSIGLAAHDRPGGADRLGRRARERRPGRAGRISGRSSSPLTTIGKAIGLPSD